MVPSNASAAMATVSDRVGWGWMVRPMSAASAPVSMARAASAMRSPAFGADDARADDPVGGLVEQDLGDALVPTQRQAAAGGGPGEHALAVLDARGLGLVLGDPDPGDLGVGVGHRRDHGGVEVAVVSGGVLRGDLALVGGLMREHRLADDVADGEDVRHVGALLLVDRDGVHVGGGRRERHRHRVPTGLVLQLLQEERRPLHTVELHHGVQSFSPLLGLARVLILGHLRVLLRSALRRAGQRAGERTSRTCIWLEVARTSSGQALVLRPRVGARGRSGVGQGESSSRTLPLVSIPNRAVIRPPMSAMTAKARNT